MDRRNGPYHCGSRNARMATQTIPRLADPACFCALRNSEVSGGGKPSTAAEDVRAAERHPLSIGTLTRSGLQSPAKCQVRASRLGSGQRARPFWLF